MGGNGQPLRQRAVELKAGAGDVRAGSDSALDAGHAEFARIMVVHPEEPMSRLVCYFSANERGLGDAVIYRGLGADEHRGHLLLSTAIQAGEFSTAGREIVIRAVLTPEARLHEASLESHFRAINGLEGLTWCPLSIGNAGGAAVDEIVAQVLVDARDDDEILIEPTLGPRSFSYGLFTAAVLLRALRPTLRVGRLLYAEQVFGAPQVPGPACPSCGLRPPPPRQTSVFQVQDITSSLDRIDWAQAAYMFADALLARGLLDRLGITDEVLRLGLAAGLSPRVMAGLRNFAPSAPSTAEGAASLALVNSRLHGLTEAARRTAPNTLGDDWLLAELELAREFVRAGRLGDAARVLREFMVNAVILKMPPRENWMSHKGRAAAESWLNARVAREEPWGELLRLWKDVNTLRNPLSHAGYVGTEATEIRVEQVPGFCDRARDWYPSLSSANAIDPVAAPNAVAVFAPHDCRPNEAILREVIGRPVDCRPAEVPTSGAGCRKLARELDDAVGWAWIGSDTGLYPRMVQELLDVGIVCVGPGSNGVGHRAFH